MVLAACQLAIELLPSQFPLPVLAGDHLGFPSHARRPCATPHARKSVRVTPENVVCEVP